MKGTVNDSHVAGSLSLSQMIFVLWTYGPTYIVSLYCSYMRVCMGEDVYEKPLTPKDFVERKGKSQIERPKLYKRVKKLPEPRRRKVQSRYSELIDAIAKEKKGTYKILLSAIQENLTLKSAYPSLEKALIQIAKRNGVDFNTPLERQVNTKKGVRTYVSYPQYAKWKEENMRLRVANNELFIEKKTDRAL